MTRRRSRLALGVSSILVLVCACGGSQRVGPPRASLRSDEGHRIHAVRFEGVTGLDSDRIVERLAARGPDGLFVKDYALYERLSLRLDARRIEAFYAENGYFSAKVPSWNVAQVADGSVDVIFKVEEGEPTRTTRVTIEGAPELPEVPATSTAHLVDLFGLAPGSIFVHADFVKGREMLRAELVQLGWVYAEVSGDVEVDREQRTAAIRVVLEPGIRYRFGALKIAGAAGLPEESVRARIPWREGDIFDPSLLVRFQSRLRGFGPARITYAVNPSASDRLLITATLGVGIRHDLRLGGGVRLSSFEKTDEGLGFRIDPRLRASYVLARVFDPLSTLSVDIRPGWAFFLNQEGDDGFAGSLTATLERHDLLWPYLHGALTAAYDFDVLEAYQATGPRIRLGLDQQLLDEQLRLSCSWQLRAVDIEPTGGDAALEAALAPPAPYRLAALTESLVWDRRDAPLAPHRGTLLSLALAQGGIFAGGAIDYLRLDIQGSAYLPLGNRLVLAARGHFGALWSLSNGDPITERFFSGGVDMRGFGYRRLAPDAADSTGRRFPVGGNAIAGGSVEARLLVFRLSASYGIELTAFLDVGDVAPAPADLAFTRLHWAVGTGIYLLTPIGPLGVDIGFRLNRREPPNPDPGSWGAINLTLGEAF